jgi:putative phage-type endonuclease
MDAQQKAEIRRSGIGGSDIAAIVGQHPYKNVHDVWAEKVGLTTPTDEFPSEAAYWGAQIEDILAAEYARRENVRLLHVPAADGIVRSAEHFWMMGSPDRLVDGDPLVGCELKMAGLRQIARWGPDGTDAMPDEYLIQCQWYAKLTDASRWDLAVLLGQQFRIYRIYPHPELQAAMFEIGRKFWFDHVVPKVPPPIDHSEGAKRLLAKIYPWNTEQLRGATDEEIALASMLRHVTRDIDERDQLFRATRNKLCDRIGLADGIEGPGFKLTWKRTKDLDFTDWKGLALGLLDAHGYTKDLQQTMIAQRTEKKKGVRRFVARFADGDEEAGSDAY